MSKRYFLDLFSGIGGFALGAEWAGLKFDGHYYSDIEEYANKVYQLRFPDAIPLGDICKINVKDLPDGEWIIAGGFPCQDISVAGKGAGLDGARSGLWFEYARLIGELRPRFAIMENVGALTHRGLDRVLGSLAEIGYDAEWQDIRASDVGAPHRRERIWIVSYPNSDIESISAINVNTLQWQLDDLAYPRRELRDARNESAMAAYEAERSPCVIHNQPSGEGQDVADSERIGQSGSWQPINASDSTQGCERQTDNAIHERIGNQWTTEPTICGMVDGIPDGLHGYRGRVANGIANRSDRLKCLGNSIVPQIAMLIFMQIKDILEP